MASGLSWFKWLALPCAWIICSAKKKWRPAMKLEYVKDWMSSDLITITPDTTLPDADRLMVGKMIRRLPVVEDGRLVGIVTYGDIRDARPSRALSLNIWELNYLVTRLRVSEIMTRNPITVRPEATIGEAARLMLRNMISGLPVVDEDGDLVGIVTESDIFRMVVRDWLDAREQSQDLTAVMSK
jgi:acetoin utilization protein AcuB